MLPAANRLSKEKDFKKTFQKGKSFFTKILGVKILKNNLEASRFGIVVSTKISKKAVQRNKIKRQIREVLRLNLDKVKPGFDVVIITLPAIRDLKYADTEKELLTALKKLNILQ